MKRLSGTICAFLLVLIAAPVANAHQGNPNFRSEITSITPVERARGLQMSVKNFDDNIELINRTGEVVLVRGYDGEPYVRFDPDGLVSVNLNSPAYYLNEDRLGNVSLPDRADSGAAPDWEEVDDSGTWFWHDHRSHYMSEGIPPQVADKSVVTKIFDYTIPMSVGGAPVEARGTLTWVGSDSSVPVLPFVLLGFLVIVSLAGAVLIRRRRQGEKAEADPPEGGPSTEAW
jgi:hypothetical protein